MPITKYYFYNNISYLLVSSYWFTGKDGDIGPEGFRGLDGQKGMRGDNGTTTIGEDGEKGVYNFY